MKILVVIFVLLFSLTASAQKDKVASRDTRPPSAQGDSEGFEPVDGNMMAQGESLPASRLVAGAYGFICAALVVYIGSVASRTRRLEEETETLLKKLEKK